jgi:hypothetical protein
MMCNIDILVIVDVSLDHLAGAVFVRLLNYEVTMHPLRIKLLILEKGWIV